MKKKFIPCQNSFLLSYRPAELKTLKYRWFIEFYQLNPATGKLERERPTFNLNKIKDKRKRKRKRKRRANELVKELNDKLLPNGYPYSDHEKDLVSKEDKGIGKLREIPIMDAIEIAYKMKTRSGKRNTIKSYKTPKRHFAKFLEHSQLSSISIGDFSQNTAFLFSDYLEVELEVKARAYNNYIRLLSTGQKQSN